MKVKEVNVDITASGFVNWVDGNRIGLGTGSYLNKEGQREFRTTITVYLDQKYDGITPAKGDYVTVSGTLWVRDRKDQNPPKEGEEGKNVTMNVRFANQLVKSEPPRRKSEAPAAAPTDDAGDDDI